MEWKRDPILDTYTLEVPEGIYCAMRTWADVAVLYFNNTELRRSASDGSHEKNRAFAEAHLKALREEQSS